MKKIRFNSILSRLFISLLLVIIPVMLMGILMFLWEKDTIKAQIRDSAADNVSFLQRNLEDEVENIKLLQYNLNNDVSLDNLLTRYSHAPKYEYYTLINDAQQRLKVMKSSNNYIEDVKVYIPQMNHTISATDGFLDMNDGQFRQIFQAYQNAKYPLLMDEPAIYSVYSPFSKKKAEEPLYLTQVVLSRNKIENFLNKFSKYNVSDTALYDVTTGSWIFNAQSSLGGTDGAKLSTITKADGKNVDAEATIGKENYFIVSVYSKYLNAYFVQYVPTKDIFRTPDFLSSFLWFYALLLAVILFLYSHSTYRLVKYPVNAVLAAFRQVEGGNLAIRVSLKATNEFNDLFDGFNKMVCRLNDLIDKVYRQELYAKKAELKQLQSQISPHFLYNSYFMLRRMIIDRDMENAELLSGYLGKYFEYITRNASEEVALEKEVEHARSYAQIQQMRFARQLSIDFGVIPEKFRSFMVPPVILQPIVENSFQHGLKSTVKNGLVKVDFTDLGTGLLICVEDSGGELSDGDLENLAAKLADTDDKIETTGIINVHRRIVLRYGQGSGVSVFRSKLGGLGVCVKMMEENGETKPNEFITQ